MKKVFQTRFGKDGNCWSACLATIFDVPLEAVDQCACNHPDWWEQSAKFLADRGLYQIEIKAVMEDGRLTWPFVALPLGTICVLCGKSSSELNHVVVVRYHHKEISPTQADIEFYLVHDPHPDGVVS